MWLITDKDEEGSKHSPPDTQKLFIATEITEDFINAKIEKSMISHLEKTGLPVDTKEIETFRDNMRFLGNLRGAYNKALKMIGISIMLAIISAIGFLIKSGFDVFIKEQ